MQLISVFLPTEKVILPGWKAFGLLPTLHALAGHLSLPITLHQPNYPPISHFLKSELLQIRPIVGGYIAF